MKRLARSVGGVMVAVALMLFSLPSCSSVTPHENFKSHMQFNVGKRADDPSSYLSRYPQRIAGSRTLANGNIETEYRRSDTCRVFFEIDDKTRIIVGWRFEGSERDCEIVP